MEYRPRGFQRGKAPDSSWGQETVSERNRLSYWEGGAKSKLLEKKKQCLEEERRGGKDRRLENIRKKGGTCDDQLDVGVSSSPQNV